MPCRARPGSGARRRRCSASRRRGGSGARRRRSDPRVPVVATPACPSAAPPRSSRAAAAASGAFVIAPPTMTTAAPAATALGAVAALIPPATVTGIRTAAVTALQHRERVVSLHLLVDRAVDVDEVGADRLGVARARDRVGVPEQVHEHLDAVVAPRLDALRRASSPTPRRVRCRSWHRPSRRTRARAARRPSSSRRTRSGCVGKRARRARTAPSPSALRSGVPTSSQSTPPCDALLGGAQRAVEVDVVEGELEAWGGHAPHRTGRAPR